MDLRSANKYLYYALILLVIGIGVSRLIVNSIDYPVFELAGLKILHGKALELYDLKRTTMGGYYYPYFFALVFSVFSSIGFVGKTIFYILIFLSYIKILKFSIENVLELLGEKDSIYRYLIYSITLLATSYAISDAFITGNVGIFLLVLSIYAYELKDKHPIIAGALMAAAVVFKIFPALILCFFVWNKNWKMVTSAILFLIFFYAGTPILFNGYNDGVILISDQYTMLNNYNTTCPLRNTVFQSFTSTMLRMFPSLEVKHVVLPSFFAIFICFLPSFLRKKKNIAEPFRLKMFFLILALVPMLTPVSWYNMALFYTPIIAYMVCLALIKKDRIAATAFCTYFILFCLTTAGIVGNKTNDLLEYYAVPFIGITIMLIGYLIRLKRDPDCGSL